MEYFHSIERPENIDKQRSTLALSYVMGAKMLDSGKDDSVTDGTKHEIGEIALRKREEPDTVSERRKGDASLLLLQAAIARTSDIILITEAELVNEPGLRIVFVNDAFTRQTGYAREEVLGKTPHMLYGPETNPVTLAQITEALNTFRPIREELIHYTKEGFPFWWEVDISPIADESGAYTHWVTVARDVTQRKQAEEDIRISKERYEFAIGGSRDGIWDWDLKRNVIYYSPRFQELSGFPSTEFTDGMDAVTTVVHPDDVERMAAAMQAHLIHRELFHIEYRRRLVSGEYRWFLGRGQAIWDSEGKPIRMAGVLTDIHDAKLLQEQLRAANETLEKIHEQLETRVEERTQELQQVSDRLLLATCAGNVGIWDWDISKNVLLWDYTIYNLYGINPEQFAGDYSAWRALVCPEDQGRLDEEIQTSLHGLGDFDSEFRVLWPDNSVHHIKAHGLVYRDLSRRPMRMLGTFWDITERKLWEKELAAANKELEAFSYSISHDLRAPLRAIDGFSRIVMEDFGPQLPPDAQEYLRDIRTNVQQMGNLVNDLLAFSQLGRQAMNMRAIPMDGLVKQCFNSLSVMWEGRQVDFQLENFRNVRRTRRYSSRCG